MSEGSLPARVDKAINRGVERASELYGDNTALRAIVVSIPYLGSGLDLIFAAEGQRAFKERIQKLLKAMSERMGQLEESDLTPFSVPGAMRV